MMRLLRFQFKFLNLKDKGNIIIPTVGERGRGIDDITKEIIANDAIELGPSAAARIHGCESIYCI
jgi:hypothetical protein